MSKLICCFCETVYTNDVKICGFCNEYKGLMTIEQFEINYL
jgi:hypothetical protein